MLSLQLHFNLAAEYLIDRVDILEDVDDDVGSVVDVLAQLDLLGCDLLLTIILIQPVVEVVNQIGGNILNTLHHSS